MLTPEEKDFIQYWEKERLNTGMSISKLSAGLPLALMIILATFVSLFTGWHKKAYMVMRSHSSVILVIIFATFGIIFFIGYFSAQHKKEQMESRYQQLLHKKQITE